MYMTHNDARKLRHMIENILENPEMPIFEDPEILQYLKKLQLRLALPGREEVSKLREYAEDYYGSDTDEHQISFDDAEATWVSKAEDEGGAWVSCWAWVPEELMREFTLAKETTT